MFSIDRTIRITHNQKTGETTTANFKLKNEFDLQNWDTYDLKGNIIKIEDQSHYDFEMSIKLERTYPYYKCADLLDYHFNKTKDKDLFLKHLKHVLLYKWTTEQPEKRKFINEWISDKQISDLDYIIGKITLINTFNGYFTINRGQFKREFTIEKYFELDLENWTNSIDKSINQNEKIQIANNGILQYKKILLRETQPQIEKLVNKNIEYLKYCIEYINSNNDTTFKKEKKSKNSKNGYSQRQIAIAYYIIGKPKIDLTNYKEILKKHSTTTSPKILQKLITKNSQLIELTEDKSADTKHLNDLNKAVELLRGIKKIHEAKRLKAFISAFESKYTMFY